MCQHVPVCPGTRGARNEGTGCPRVSAEVTSPFTPSRGTDTFMSPCAMAWKKLGQPCCKEWREPGQHQHHHAGVAPDAAFGAKALLESSPSWMAIQGWVAKATRHTFMWDSVRGPRCRAGGRLEAGGGRGQSEPGPHPRSPREMGG